MWPKIESQDTGNTASWLLLPCVKTPILLRDRHGIAAVTTVGDFRLVLLFAGGLGQTIAACYAACAQNSQVLAKRNLLTAVEGVHFHL